MNFWKQRNVFVTGASGLLGSWLVQELLSRQANVICLMRDWIPVNRLLEEDLLGRCHIVRGELEDYAVVLRTLNEYEVDSVFHLGAQTIVGTANRSPLSTFESNIRGTWHLLEASRECASKLERVIIASSDKAYGSHENLPYKEESPLQGRFPYDVSKSCADLIAISYFHTFQVPIAITRCGNLYGGGDLNFNRLVPGTIRSILNNEPPVIRSDGQFVRDYFYVRDAVDAYLMLAEQVSSTALSGQAFNFGNESPVTVLELVKQILELMNATHLEPQILNQAIHEIPAQYLDCSKARNLLSWKPKFTLRQGLKETIDWYANREKASSPGLQTPLM
ncbi:MAG: GDP-mannose 4,6-dehydratase [Acidobacteriota bacterium]